MSTCIIVFYVHNSFLLYNGCLETAQINNKKIFHFVDIWSKEVPNNISYPSTVNKIDGYLDASIIPIYVRCIIERDKQIK